MGSIRVPVLQHVQGTLLSDLLPLVQRVSGSVMLSVVSRPSSLVSLASHVSEQVRDVELCTRSCARAARYRRRGAMCVPGGTPYRLSVVFALLTVRLLHIGVIADQKTKHRMRQITRCTAVPFSRHGEALYVCTIDDLRRRATSRKSRCCGRVVYGSITKLCNCQSVCVSHWFLYCS